MPITSHDDNVQRDITKLLGGPVAAGELYSNLLAKGEAHETPSHVSGSGGAGSGSGSAPLGKLTGGETRAGTSPHDADTIREALGTALWPTRVDALAALDRIMLKLDCANGDGWLTDDLECDGALGSEPMCYKHAIEEHRRAWPREAALVEALLIVDECGYHDTFTHDSACVLANASPAACEIAAKARVLDSLRDELPPLSERLYLWETIDKRLAAEREKDAPK